MLRGTVLIVDDEEPVRSVAAAVLEMHGAQVFVAASGEAALALLQDHDAKITLVLLDMTMPGIDGEETLRRMRMRNFRQPVILMSGYHGWMVSYSKKLAGGKATLSGKQLRLINELPALFVAFIVILVVVKPF